MAEHNEFGKQGEILAAQYLESKGYIVLDRDWHYGKSKIDLDIVAKSPSGDTVVFVEVKSRRPNELVSGLKAITRQKIKRICLAADRYIKMYRITERIRFDVVLVHVDKRTAEKTIQHIEAAFHPMNR